jgi:spastic paraplegia protein 7
MLAKGEVEEVIVRPDVDIVTIILHDGAIIKGKRVRNRMHLEYFNNSRFASQKKYVKSYWNLLSVFT